MDIHLKGAIAGGLLASMLSLQCSAPAPASANWYGYNPYYNRPYYNPYSVFTTHPILSGMVVGGAIGAAGGAAVGAIQNQRDQSSVSDQSISSGGSRIGHDAAVGAGAGAVLGTAVGIYRNVKIHRYGY